MTQMMERVGSVGVGTPADPLCLNGMTPESFDVARYLAQFDQRLLTTSEGRRIVTRTNPLLFALLYLRHHITDALDRITFAECHFDWCKIALSWLKRSPGPMEIRDAVIAPRDTGKTTWFFLILPMWAAAHGHVNFAAAFADSTGQSQLHLRTFKHELDFNGLLIGDYPDLCEPAVKRQGGAIADNAGMIRQRNGFTFAARGIDASSLGMKVEEHRPDLIILDDIEPDESGYSVEQAVKRLRTVRDSIFYLNIAARVVMIGTVTMPESLMHQLVKKQLGEADPDWVREEKLKIHYHLPIITDLLLGIERSLWPGKWSLDFLLAHRYTSTYAKNFENNPIVGTGMWWRKDDIHYDRLERYDRNVLIVDGAVTTKKSSDETGLAVTALDLAGRRFFVRAALGVRQAGEELRSTVLDLVETFDINYILVEANQGGDLWHVVFHDMPVKVTTFAQKEKKEYRIRRLLAAYQRDEGRVFHERKLQELERQQLAYPHVTHEDVLDAVAAGVEHLTHMLLRAVGKGRATAKTVSYKRSSTSVGGLR